MGGSVPDKGGPHEIKVTGRTGRNGLSARLREAGLSARRIGRIASIGEDAVQRAE